MGCILRLTLIVLEPIYIFACYRKRYNNYNSFTSGGKRGGMFFRLISLQNERMIKLEHTSRPPLDAGNLIQLTHQAIIS